MTNDERAKAYELALEAARKELGVDRKEWEVVQRVLHNIFPELRESEDEMIRKGMIRFLESEQAEGIFTYEARQSWIAYLEKQKEPTPADGWDYADKRMSHPLYLEGFEAGRAVERELSEFEKQKEQKPVKWNDADMREARENLISVCRDWERGEQTTLLPIVACRARYFLEHLIESQKPAWSEEDEKHFKACVRVMRTYEGNDTPISKWIEALKDRVCHHPSWKPSEEQMKALEVAFRKDGDDNYRNAINSLYNDLKKL